MVKSNGQEDKMTRYPTSADLAAMRDAIYREDARPDYMHPPEPGAWSSERYRGIGQDGAIPRAPVAFADIAAMRAAMWQKSIGHHRIHPDPWEGYPTWESERRYGMPEDWDALDPRRPA